MQNQTTPITPALNQVHVGFIQPDLIRGGVRGLRLTAQGLDLEIQCSVDEGFCLRHLAQQQQDQSVRDVLMALVTGWPEFLDVCPRFRSPAAPSCKCSCACSSPSSSPNQDSNPLLQPRNVKPDVLAIAHSVQKSLPHLIKIEDLSSITEGLYRDLDKRTVYISRAWSNSL